MTTSTTMRLWSDERGIVLPLALIMVAIIVPLMVAVVSVGSLETSIASNYMRGAQAQYVAEAGLEDAFNALRAAPANLNTAPAAPALADVPGVSGGGAGMAPFGTYTARYQAAGANTVLIVITASSALGGGQRQIRATFGNTFAINHGILTGGHLTISGNPIVTGTCGSVHANGNISISGNPNVEGDVHASGTYTQSGNPVVGGTKGGGMPYQTVPNIDPLDFFTAAKAAKPANQVYDFGADGKVYNGAGTLLATVSPGNSYGGAKYEPGSPTKWTVESSTPVSGTLLFRSDVVISANPGHTGTKWTASILATGSIEVSGNPGMLPHLQDTALVAGKDVKISGNPDMTGLVAAREQVQVSGMLTLTGAIIAQDAGATSATVVFDQFNGNSEITCSELTPPLNGALRVLSVGR